MADELLIHIFDVEHGACAMLEAPSGRLAMIDSGHNATKPWWPSIHIRYAMRRTVLDYLIVTNADQDHLSDLDGLRTERIDIGVLYRNPSPSAAILRQIKERQCPTLTNDIERYLQMHRDYVGPVGVPFNAGMGGVTASAYWNTYPTFTETNDLSFVVFIAYNGFKILFPGDLEEASWEALLARPAFVEELKSTNILVASHHGRRNGFCRAAFDHFTPDAIVISDKPKAHLTQDLDYGPLVNPRGVAVSNQSRRRHILTTRRDGDIVFRVGATSYSITTEKDSYQMRAA